MSQDDMPIMKLASKICSCKPLIEKSIHYYMVSINKPQEYIAVLNGCGENFFSTKCSSHHVIRRYLKIPCSDCNKEHVAICNVKDIPIKNKCIQGELKNGIQEQIWCGWNLHV